MENNFMGDGNLPFFIGVVESNADPLGFGRVRVRMFGRHNQDDVALPMEALPWAFVMMPATNAGVGGVGQAAVGLQPGSRVCGFILDGKEAQRLLVIGNLPGETGQIPTYAPEYGSTPQLPLLKKIMGYSPFNKESDCPEGDAPEATKQNLAVPKQDLIAIDKGEWVIPFSGFVSSPYGARGKGHHRGVDICPAGYYKQTEAGAKHLNGRLMGPCGLPVYAAADGVVKHIWRSNQGQSGRSTQYDRLGPPQSRSYGNAIAIKHSLSTGTYLTIYAHLGVSQDPNNDAAGAGISVKIGDKVSKGQQIGSVGRSHCWDSLTHLHFEIRDSEALPKAQNHINPGRVFPQLYHCHTAQKSWAKNQTNYNVKELPYDLDDLPVVAGTGPKI